MGEHVLITGGTGLLGKEFVKEFLANGYTVIYTSSSPNKIEQMNKDFQVYYARGNLHGILVDLVREDAMQIISDFLQARNIYPEYLINNARSIEYITVKDYRDIETEKWVGEYILDVVVPYKLMVMLSRLRNTHLKAVVNIASMYGLLAYNEYLCQGSKSICINYGVCKAGQLQLTREMAVRFAEQGIRVNAISYGGVAGRADASFMRRYAELCPSRKMLAINEVAGHAVYLCSDQSLGMTGHNLVVDGGFSVW